MTTTQEPGSAQHGIESTSTRSALERGGYHPGWVLVGSAGMWAADCLSPGCLWSITTSTAEAADTAAETHIDKHVHYVREVREL